MSWTERSTESSDAPDEETAVTGGPGPDPTAGDVAANARVRAVPRTDGPPSGPDAAATTLGLGLGNRRVETLGSEPGTDAGEGDVPRDRGGEAAGGAVGAVGGVVIGTVLAGPAGAIVGGIVGAAAGDVAGRSVERQAGAAGADADQGPDAERAQNEADPLT